MKIMMMLAFVGLLLSTSLYAQLPHQGYIGLFGDDSRSSWCVSGTGFYPVEMWIWCLPSEREQICVEFGLNYPSNIIKSTTTLNLELFDIAPWDYFCLCYRSCQHDWHWVWHQLMYVTGSEQTAIEITVHSESGLLQFANCDPGYPTESCTIFTNLYINYLPDDPVCTGTSLEDVSWGAIKSLYISN